MNTGITTAARLKAAVSAWLSLKAQVAANPPDGSVHTFPLRRSNPGLARIACLFKDFAELRAFYDIR